MTEIHEEETRLEAWVQATMSIMNEDVKQDIIMHIESPSVQHESTQEVFDELNQLYTDADMEPIHTVAEWVFPGWLYQREGLDGLFNSYPEQLQTILENSNSWGTYFGRMIERKNPETGENFNPLKNLIEKMNRANQPERQTFHSCYEIEVQGPSFDIPLYDSVSDRKQCRGLPCLSHLSFKLFNGKVHLTALYRSHDYRFKVPGNLLGLARLQACVANEIDADIGQLVVHSSRAFVDDGRAGMGEFRDLVELTSKRINNQSLAGF